MRQVALAALVLVSCAGLGAGRQQINKLKVAKELEPLQGMWRQEYVISNGQKTGYARGEEPILTVRADHYTVEVNGKLLEGGTIKLDPDAPRRAFDLHITDGLRKGKVFPGIYEISGDELRACLARSDVPRPTAFAAGPSSGLAVAVYRRLPPPK